MVKVVDIPEMNYFAKNGEGEVSFLEKGSVMLHMFPARLEPGDTLLSFVLVDLYPWPQCIQRLSEGPREDSGGLGQ